jgi:hypothetical protein
MRRHTHAAAILIMVPLLLFGAALAGEGVEVKITNDSTADIMVTVYDLNSVPKRAVLTNARINGFTSVPVSVVGDASGRAKLSWTATNVDTVSRKCGHDDATAETAGSVKVHADSTCEV